MNNPNHKKYSLNDWRLANETSEIRELSHPPNPFLVWENYVKFRRETI